MSPQEADNWTTLLADVDEVFGSQDLQKASHIAMVTCVYTDRQLQISTKLLGMQQSLVCREGRGWEEGWREENVVVWREGNVAL